MADRVTHRCPNCGEIAVFFYDRSWDSSCDSCGKWWHVKTVLVEVPGPTKSRQNVLIMDSGWYRCEDCGKVYHYDMKDETVGCVACNSPNLISTRE